MDFKTPLSSRRSDCLAPLLKTLQVAHCGPSSLQHPAPLPRKAFRSHFPMVAPLPLSVMSYGPSPRLFSI